MLKILLRPILVLFWYSAAENDASWFSCFWAAFKNAPSYSCFCLIESCLKWCSVLSCSIFTWRGTSLIRVSRPRNIQSRMCSTRTQNRNQDRSEENQETSVLLFKSRDSKQQFVKTLSIPDILIFTIFIPKYGRTG